MLDFPAIQAIDPLDAQERAATSNPDQNRSRDIMEVLSYPLPGNDRWISGSYHFPHSKATAKSASGTFPSFSDLSTRPPFFNVLETQGQKRPKETVYPFFHGGYGEKRTGAGQPVPGLSIPPVPSKGGHRLQSLHLETWKILSCHRALFTFGKRTWADCPNALSSGEFLDGV